VEEGITSGDDRSSGGFSLKGGDFERWLGGLRLRRLSGGGGQFDVASAVVLAANKVGRWREGRAESVAVATGVIRREVVVQGAVGAQQAVASAIATRPHPQDHKQT
jgi:hypothetical protein